MDARRIELTAADGDLPTGEVGGDRAAVHSEEGCQLDERRALAILRHQIVDLLGAQQPVLGLNLGQGHPKLAPEAALVDFAPHLAQGRAAVAPGEGRKISLVVKGDHSIIINEMLDFGRGPQKSSIFFL